MVNTHDTIKYYVTFMAVVYSTKQQMTIPNRNASSLHKRAHAINFIVSIFCHGLFQVIAGVGYIRPFLQVESPADPAQQS